MRASVMGKDSVWWEMSGTILYRESFRTRLIALAWLVIGLSSALEATRVEETDHNVAYLGTVLCRAQSGGLRIASRPDPALLMHVEGA